MHIERAYCVELERVVDIYEARNHFFRQTPPRKRFRFLCSDKKCREANGTKVTGVNYDKLVEESDQYVKAHFRENTEHAPDCEWTELERALKELKEETGSDLRYQSDSDQPRRRRNPKSSDVVDIFVPSATAVEPITIGGARGMGLFPREMSEVIKQISHRRQRIEVIKQFLRDNPNQTGFLENVVDSYLALSPDERRSIRLKIGRSPWRSYRKCFRQIRFYDSECEDKFIYYGGVRAKPYGPHFSLTFFDPAVFEGVQRLVSIYIKREKLNAYKHRAYLTEFLEKLVNKHARYAICYFYGQIRPSPNNESFLNVELDHFDNLIRVMS